MAKPIAYPFNLLEVATSVTATGAEATAPVTRLYDRGVTFRYKDDATTSPRDITTHQTGSEAVDALLIAAGHVNLEGLAIALAPSADDVIYGADLVSFTAPSGVIVEPFDSSTAAYHRLRITSPTNAIEIPELFLSRAVPFPVGPNLGAARRRRYGIHREQAPGGAVRKSLRWGPLWSASYALTHFTATGLQALEDLLDALSGGVKPFFLTDEFGITRWVEWLNGQEIAELVVSIGPGSTTPYSTETIEVQEIAA